MEQEPVKGTRTRAWRSSAGNKSNMIRSFALLPECCPRCAFTALNSRAVGHSSTAGWFEASVRYQCDRSAPIESSACSPDGALSSAPGHAHNQPRRIAGRDWPDKAANRSCALGQAQLSCAVWIPRGLAGLDGQRSADGVRFCSSVAAAERCRGGAKVQYFFMDLGPSFVQALS